MKININKKISEKIRKKNLPSNIKDLIGDILIFELYHFEEERPRFTEQYEQFIRKYIKKI